MKQKISYIQGRLDAIATCLDLIAENDFQMRKDTDERIRQDSFSIRCVVKALEGEELKTATAVLTEVLSSMKYEINHGISSDHKLEQILFYIVDTSLPEIVTELDNMD